MKRIRPVTISKRSLAQIYSPKRAAKRWKVLESVMRMDLEMKALGRKHEKHTTIPRRADAGRDL